MVGEICGGHEEESKVISRKPASSLGSRNVACTISMRLTRRRRSSSVPSARRCSRPESPVLRTVLSKTRIVSRWEARDAWSVLPSSTVGSVCVLLGTPRCRCVKPHASFLCFVLRMWPNRTRKNGGTRAPWGWMMQRPPALRHPYLCNKR